MLRLVTIIAALIVSVPASAASLLTQDQLGFTFTLPPFPAQATGQVFMVFLPPADGFAANINLQIQAFRGTLADYHQATQKEFAGMGLKAVAQDIGMDEARYEYTGTMNKLELHWLARARKSGDRIHLLTATGLASRWAEDGPALTAAVDSYTLTENSIKDVIVPTLP